MSAPSPPAGKPRLRLRHLLPLGLFAALAMIFLLRLESPDDRSAIPSALIGKPAPEFALPPLDGLGVPGLERADLDGHVTLVNVFASWCAPCRQEHPLIAALAREGVRVVGIDYKDAPANALSFLNETGNPFAAVGVDRSGRSAIDWGVYGVPETFVVGPGGIIVYKHIGVLTGAAIEQAIRPAMAKAARPAG